jgi:haloacetate dehalogenase
MDGLIAGFARRRVPGEGVEIDALVGGSGPPLLLLHGFPQTRVMWKAVAPLLAERFTLVMPDLRGYGRSDKPHGDAAHQLYAKRMMALDQIATMRALGFATFAVAGHDRGARVAYRLALDHPAVVSHLALLDILPTLAQWANVDAAYAMRIYHWMMLAQPYPLPETLVGGDPGFFCRWCLADWAAEGFVFDADSLEDYVRCFADPAAIHGACADYRAGWFTDRLHDEADLGRVKLACPTLLLYGADYGVAKAGPLARWTPWAANQLTGQSVPGGHFVAEEAPAEVTTAFSAFFDV